MTIPIKFSNVTTGTLSAPVLIGDTSLTYTVVAGSDAFPVVSSPNYFYATIIDAASFGSNTYPPTYREVVKCTNNGGGTMTIVRAQDGTSARAWAAGDRIELRINNKALTDITDQIVLTPQMFGAVGDGTTDDTAAITAAYTACPTGGKIYFPKGTYKITSKITLAKSITLEGDKYNSVIASNSGTAGCFLLTASYITIKGLTFTPSAAQTAGNAIEINTSLRGFKIEDCTFWNFWIGILTAATQVDITHCFFYCNVASASSIGIKITGGADVAISHVLMDADANIANGIYITSVLDLNIEDVNLIHCGSCIGMVPAAAGIASVNVVNGIFDTSTNGINIANGAGSVVRCKFNNCWLSSHTARGVVVGATATVIGLEFVACDMYGNTLDGILINSANCRDVIIANCNIAGNGASGISIGVTGVDYFQILGNRIGPTGGFGVNAIGIYINGTSDHFTIADNYVAANTANYAFGTLGSNVKIYGNEGLTTKNSGTATVANGTTSIAVNHGLILTPSINDICVTPQKTLNSASFWYIDTVGATQFTIHTNVDPGAAVDFSWQARVKGV